METDFMTNFDLLVKIAGGIGVIITLIKIVIPKIIQIFKAMVNKMRTTITQPHNDLHGRCDELEATMDAKFKEMALDFSKLNDSNIQSSIGVLAILYKDLYLDSKEAIKNGSISVEDKESLRIIYTAYTNMGGNGKGEDIWKQIDALPVDLD